MARGSDISQDVIAPLEIIIPSRILNTPISPKGCIYISGSKLIYSNGTNFLVLSGSAIA